MTAPDYVTMTSLKIPLALKGVSTDAPITWSRRTKGELNLKLHTVCGGEGRHIILLLAEGEMSGHKGAVSCSVACRRPLT